MLAIFSLLLLFFTIYHLRYVYLFFELLKKHLNIIYKIEILKSYLTFRLISLNLTTIEYKEKKEEMINNKYDLGIINNFIQIFGKNPFAWLFPIKNKIELGGYSFETNFSPDDQLNISKLKETNKSENFDNFKDTARSDFIIKEANKGESIFQSHAELNSRTYNI